MDFEWTYDIEDIPIGSIIRAQGLLFRTTRIKHTKSNGEDFKYGRIHLDSERRTFYLRILEIHDDCIECQTFSYDNGDYHTPIFIDPTEARNRFFKGI
jgi:hypothetical protein